MNGNQPRRGKINFQDLRPATDKELYQKIKIKNIILKSKTDSTIKIQRQVQVLDSSNIRGKTIQEQDKDIIKKGRWRKQVNPYSESTIKMSLTSRVWNAIRNKSIL